MTKGAHIRITIQSIGCNLLRLTSLHAATLPQGCGVSVTKGVSPMRAAKIYGMMVALALGAGAAEGALIRVSFEGQNSSASSANNNSLANGLTSISGYVVYDTGTASSPFVVNTSREALNYNGAIKEFAFTAGDVSGGRSGSLGSAQVSDQFTTGSDRLSFNEIRLTPDQFTNEKPGISSLQFTLGLTGPFSALSSAALPGVFDPAIFTGQKNLSLFVTLLDPASQPGVVKSLNFNFSALTVQDVTPIPLPSALGFFALGAATLAGLARRRPMQP